jgi:DNA-binding response OmpR family regulator
MAIVLVVDDSPVALLALCRRLAAEGFTVREEATAAGARALDSSDLGCAVLDLELPDGDGPALAHDLRARQASLPVAFFTAGADRSLIERARTLGAVFAKPDVEAVVGWAKRVAGQPPPTK